MYGDLKVGGMRIVAPAGMKAIKLEATCVTGSGRALAGRLGKKTEAPPLDHAAGTSGSVSRPRGSLPFARLFGQEFLSGIPPIGVTLFSESRAESGAMSKPLVRSGITVGVTPVAGGQGARFDG
ncbi:MAG: hypothetical protein ACMG6H_12460 [Acidobacteriota bacterium]